MGFVKIQKIEIHDGSSHQVRIRHKKYRWIQSKIFFIALNRMIKQSRQFQASTAQTQKKVVGHLVTYSIVIYLLVAIFAYFKLFPAARTTKVRNWSHEKWIMKKMLSIQDQLLLLLPFLVAPFLIWGLRRVLTWWYHRLVNFSKLKHCHENIFLH